MIGRLLLSLVALLLLPVQAMANDLEGTWALKIDGAVIFTFALSQDDDGDWDARWTRPAEFNSNGVVFARLSGSQEIGAMAVAQEGEAVRLTFDDPRPGADPDVFVFELVGEHQVAMTYVDTPFEPYPLVRVVPGTPLGPFEDGRIYDRDNAAVEADYVEPEPEPEPEAEPEAVAQDAVDEAALADSDVVAEAVDDVARAPRGLAADFLDGLGDGDVAPAAAPEADEPAPEEPDGARACTDLDRANLPNVAQLEELWGEDYQPIGTGLDIREYTMGNGDIARVTILGERIYVNRCGPVE